MSFRLLFVIVLLIFLSVSAFSESEEDQKTKSKNISEEEIKRQKVLKEYGKKNFVDQATEKIIQGYDTLKEQLPENIKSMLPGESPTPKDNLIKNSQTELELKSSDEMNDEMTDELNDDQASKTRRVDPEEFSKSMQVSEESFLFKMLSHKQKEAAVRMMKENPFASMKKDAIKKLILAKMDPKKTAGKYLHESPRLVDSLAEWIIDDDAIPAFVSIINKPKKAKIMGAIVVTLFIIIFFLNLKNSDHRLLTKIMIKFGLMLASTSINLIAFYLIYKEELGPSIEVFSRNF
jgi:hypothetical protein